MIKSAWGIAVLLSMSLAARGDDPPPPPPPATQPAVEMVQLTFPESLEVKLLIEYVSKRLGMNVMYDESIGRKKITMSAPAKVPKDSLPGLLNTVLRVSGLVLVDADQPGWKRIIPDKDLLAAVKTLKQDRQALAAAAATEILSLAFPLERADPQLTQQTIKPFLSVPGGSSFSIGAGGRTLLLVSDYADNLRRVAELIDLLDEAGPPVSISMVVVKHLAAAELVRQATDLLREKDRLAGQDGKAGPRRMTLIPDIRGNQIVLVSADKTATAEVTALLRLLDVATDVETLSYRMQFIPPDRIDKLARDFAGQDPTRPPYNSTIDVESRILIVRAPRHVHDYIGTLKRDLDVQSAALEASPIRFYKLTNTTAAEVLATIRSLETGQGVMPVIVAEPTLTERPPTVEAWPGPNRPPQGPDAELPKPPAYRPADAPASQPAEGPAAAAPTLGKDAKGVSVTADLNTNTIIVVAPPAVQRIYQELIARLDKRRPQVLVEITLLTLDTSNSFSLGVEISRLTFPGTDSKLLLFSSFGLSAVDTDTGAQKLKPGIGFNGTLVDPDTVNVVIKALATSGRSTVLSAPKVLVNDNATATLASINEAPFTSINASDTVSTTSFAGYASAGTTITVTPHISEGDHLQLDYSVTLNSFTGEGAGGIPPPRQTNTVNSRVTIPDGYTIIVGGLTRQDRSHTESKVPFLGDVPVLKYLFSSQSRNNSQNTLFVFIRPIVLRDDAFEDLKFLSERDLRRAELPPNMPASTPMLMP